MNLRNWRVEVLRGWSDEPGSTDRTTDDQFGHRIGPSHGIDVIVGTPGDDTLTGTDGNDKLNGGKGADTMEGLDGKDVYLVDNAGDVVVEAGGGGKDTVVSRVSYTLGAYVENLALRGDNLTAHGNELDNHMVSEAVAGDLYGGDNYLYGGAGDDTLEGVGSLGSFDGEDGNDVIYSDGYRSESSGGIGDDEMHVLGGGFARGEDGNDTLIAGDDGLWTTLLGGYGNDVLYAGANTETYTNGDAGNDTVVGSAQDDLRLDGGADSDFVYGGSGNDILEDDYFTAAAADTLDGGDGIDRLNTRWSDATVAIVWNNDPTQATVVYGNTILGIENLNLYLGSGNDVITNHAGSSSIYAGGGNDSITGAGWLQGEAGNDTLVGGDAENDLFGQLGNDTMIGGDLADYISGESGRDAAFGNGGNDTISGDGTQDTLSGGDGLDELDLRIDEDATLNWTNDANTTQIVAGASVSGFEQLTVVGGMHDDFVSNALNTADDILFGREGNDWLVAGAGTDQLSGEEGNDTLDGGNGTDTLVGGDGDDRLAAGFGNDSLYGDAGNDVMTGGDGADTYYFTSNVGSDVINGFQSGPDMMRISNDAYRVGDGDTFIDNAVVTTGPGGFTALSEVVIVTADIAGALSADAAAAAIGNASSAYKAGRTALFVVDNGTDSAVYFYTASAVDATVSASELTLMATLKGTTTVAIDDFNFHV